MSWSSKVMRLPRGSSPGQWRRASSSLMTTAPGARRSSLPAMSRPRRIGIPHRREIAGKHDAVRGAGALSRRGEGPPLDRERPSPDVPREREMVDGARRRDAGERADPFEDLPVEGGPVPRRRLAAAGHRNRQRQDAARIEPGVDRLQGDERPDHEPGAGEQHEGERELRSDQDVAQAAAPSSLHRAPLSFPQGFRQVAPGGLEGRRETERDPGQKRDREREGEHAAVESDGLDARELLGAERDEEVRSPQGEKRSAGAAEKREHEALGQELAEHPGAAGPESGADRDLPLSRRRAREQHVGDVGAGDQEDERHRRQEHEERRPDVSDHGLLERSDGHVAVGAGELLLQAPGDRRHLGPREVERRPALQAREHPEALPSAVGGAGSEDVGRPELGSRRPERREVEALRHDPDDRVGLAVQVHRLPEDLRVAGIAPLPEAVAQHDLVFPAGFLLFRQEDAPVERPDSQHREDVRRHPESLHALRLRAARQVRDPEVRRAHPLVGRRLPPPVEEVRGSDGVDPPVKDDGEPVGVSVGKRLQEHRVDDAEDRRRGADAQRERGHRRGREPGVLPQGAKAVAKVAADGSEEGPESRVAHALLDLLDPPDLDRSLAPGFLRGHPRADLLLFQHPGVGAHFLVDLGIHPGAAEEVAPEARQSRRKRHRVPTSP